METDPTQEFEYLDYALDELEDYLLSDELFWPVTIRPSGGGSFLKLTLGNLLLSLKKLQALSAGRQLTPAQESELRRIEQAVEAVRRKWQVAWETRAGREFKSRFDQWGNLLTDIKKDYERQAPYYQHEVRLRVLLELLEPHADPEDIDGYELDAMDAFLRGMLKQGEFLWDPALKPSFPQDEYWFLYGSLSSE